MTLAQLRTGENGIIRQIDGADDSLVRLMEMGLVPGTRVQISGVAPLGDPLQPSFRGYHLSIRKREAARSQLQRVA